MGVTVQPLSALRTQSWEEHERAKGEQRLPRGPDHHAYRGDAMGDPDDIDDVPRIYVACLACYSAGRLHGRWFDVGTDPDGLHHEVLSYFATGCETCGSYEPECPECRAFATPFPCGGEELAVHDREGLGSAGEGYDLEHLCAVAALLEDFPERPVLAYLSEVDRDVEQAREGLRDSYAGSWNSAAEWAESWAEDADLGVEQLWPYVNWEAYARDLLLGGDVRTVEAQGSVHVFWR